jgi:hypothetical protein
LGDVEACTETAGSDMLQLFALPESEDESATRVARVVAFFIRRLPFPPAIAFSPEPRPARAASAPI